MVLKSHLFLKQLRATFRGFLLRYNAANNEKKCAKFINFKYALFSLKFITILSNFKNLTKDLGIFQGHQGFSWDYFCKKCLKNF